MAGVELGEPHAFRAAWAWFSLETDGHFFFCPLTQVGLLRLLATSAVMGEDVPAIGQAWKVYDRWLEDSRISVRQELSGIDAAFRAASRPVSRSSSPKALGDCYLLAVAQVANATLGDLRSRLGRCVPKGAPPRCSALTTIGLSLASRQTERPDSLVQIRPLHPEHSCRARYVPFALF